MSAAILQFEVDRKRLRKMEAKNALSAAGVAYTVTAESAALATIRAALDDTIVSGGTFVLVATDDKLTVVQRPKGDDPFEAQL